MAGNLIIANWKSQKTLSESRDSLVALTQALSSKKQIEQERILVALSPVALSLTREFNDPKLQLIAQDVSNFAPGAHTGQTTIEQLKDLGVSASLVGHSERRKECGEDDEIVVKKTIHSLRSDLEVFFCFGEDLSEREAGRTKEVLTRQILPLLQALREEGLTLEKLIFAYEPVWAIGSGLTASIEDIEEISRWLREFTTFRDLRFVYGGSVNLENIKTILSSELVDGVLVGSASTKASSFLELISASREVIKGS